MSHTLSTVGQGRDLRDRFIFTAGTDSYDKALLSHTLRRCSWTTQCSRAWGPDPFVSHQGWVGAWTVQRWTSFVCVRVDTHLHCWKVSCPHWASQVGAWVVYVTCHAGLTSIQVLTAGRCLVSSVFSIIASIWKACWGGVECQNCSSEY